MNAPRRGLDKKTGKRLYGRKWAATSAGHLRKYPFCVKCEKRGKVVLATVCDHIVPHRGDAKLFWAKWNRQGLCDNCHNSTKQIEEKGGIEPGCDERGIPLATGHHWNTNTKG